MMIHVKVLHLTTSFNKIKKKSFCYLKKIKYDKLHLDKEV